MDKRGDKMVKDRKGIARRSVLAVIGLAMLAILIGGTYARYISTATSSGSVNIAKWAVKVNDTDISAASGTFNLTFAADNADTVPNKVAPGGTATAYVDVDLTGTEVSVDFSCGLDSSVDLSSAFGADYAGKVRMSVGTPALEGTTSNMTLDADNKVVKVGRAAMSGKVRVPITLTWTNDNSNNATDTATGAAKTAVTIPVTLSVMQHISDDSQ